MLYANPNAVRNEVAHFPAEARDQPFRISIELLPQRLQAQFADLGLQFAARGTIESSKMLENSFSALKRFVLQADWVSASVRELALTAHLLESHADDFDCSYSHPEIPFSVFVSAPREARSDAALRVAESIVHEAMHLQLSIIERVIPLIREDGPGQLVHSPWKNQERPPRGILHGIYIFAILKQFWQLVIARISDDRSINFAEGRCKEIRGEICRLRTFKNSDDLTGAGKKLVTALIEFAV